MITLPEVPKSKSYISSNERPSVQLKLCSFKTKFSEIVKVIPGKILKDIQLRLSSSMMEKVVSYWQVVSFGHVMEIVSSSGLFSNNFETSTRTNIVPEWRLRKKWLLYMASSMLEFQRGWKSLPKSQSSWRHISKVILSIKRLFRDENICDIRFWK